MRPLSPARASVPRRNVHDGTDPAAITAAESSGVDVGIGNDVRIEHTKQSNAVECIVDDHPVQEHLVLDRRTSSDVQLTSLVSCGHESRQGLKHLHEVGRPSQTGNPFDVCRLNGLHRHAHSVQLLSAFGRDHRTFQLDQTCIQGNVLASKHGHRAPLLRSETACTPRWKPPRCMSRRGFLTSCSIPECR